MTVVQNICDEAVSVSPTHAKRASSKQQTAVLVENPGPEAYTHEETM